MSETVLDDKKITDSASLRAHYGDVHPLAVNKVLSSLDRHCVAFIELSPFLVMGSAAGDGSADVSPKGDAPGFVKVLDGKRLAIPDRRGNNRADSLGNIVENPHVALIFMVPGMNETLRINGRARISIEPDLLAEMAVQGKTPNCAIVVDVDEAFMHCPKAFIRSKLWASESQIDRKSFPTLGRILADQVKGVDAPDADQKVEEDSKYHLY
ncbi:MAG: pyridoxamine 5'-phosphate oxidase family protein [Alphaproteobacteria bacterium]